MRKHFASISTLGLIAVALLGACSGGGDSTGAAGTTAAGSAGTTGAGTAGTTAAGTAGTTAAGTAGTTAAGTAGTTAAGTAGTTAAGTAGTMGTAGTGAAGMGAAGTGAAGTGAGVPAKSVGCGMAPPTADSQTTFVKHDIAMVPGVDAAFIAMYSPNTGSAYSWTKRNYFVRLPRNYSPDQAYAVDLAGTGCAGGETAGQTGEYTLPMGATQMEAIQIGLSYVVSVVGGPHPAGTIGASNCSGFVDDFPNSPEPMYLNAVIDEISSRYCIDKNKVFINGYSSGAFLSVMAGGTNADKIRGIGIQIGGGLRMKRPTYMTKPVAAFFVVGLQDTGNPIGPLTTPVNDTLGSFEARDELLKRNGCVAPGVALTTTDAMKYGSAPHEMWDAAYPKCHRYTGCPAKYPVVWCPLDVNHGNGPNPMGGDAGLVESYRRAGLWKFNMSLPAP